MERTFSAQMAATGDRTYAATKAGYSHPVQAGAKLSKHPGVVADMQRQIENELQNDLAPLATWRLRKVMLDDSQKGSVHVAGAKLILDYALKRIGAAERDLSEMTAEQIRELLVETERAYAARMKVVESPQSAQAAPNLFD
jgi:hypothetical protein